MGGPKILGAEVSFPRGRSVFCKWPKCLFMRGRSVLTRAEVSFPKGAQGAEVAGAEVVGVEVSNPPKSCTVRETSEPYQESREETSALKDLFQDYQIFIWPLS